MNINKALSIGLFSTLLYSNTAVSEDNTSFGLGIGSLYNGLGMAYGYKSETNYKYISLGCLSLSYSSINGGEYNCGVGAGFVMTDLFEFDSNKHGFGAHASITYNDRYSQVEYFVAPQYVYYFKGVNKSGWNIGGSLRIGEYDNEFEVTPTFQVGYQF